MESSQRCLPLHVVPRPADDNPGNEAKTFGSKKAHDIAMISNRSAMTVVYLPDSHDYSIAIAASSQSVDIIHLRIILIQSFALFNAGPQLDLPCGFWLLTTIRLHFKII